MGLVFIFLTGIATGLSGAMIPGPLTIFTVSGTLHTDKFAGFKTITGHIIVEFALIAAILLGFRPLLTNEKFLLIVSIAGGAELIGMGVLLLVTAGKMKLADIKNNSHFDKGLVIGGIIFSMVSPGLLVWWATIGLSTIIKASLFGIIGIIILIIGHWFADVVWYGFLSYAVDRGKMYLSDRAYQHCVRGCAVLLIGVGIMFLF